MSLARPILQSSRQLDIPAAAGQVTFAWPLPLFDPADLEVQLLVAPQTLFQPVTGGITIEIAADESSAVVTFAQAPCAYQGQAVTCRLIGRRVQSRTGNVTRGGTVSSSWLEDEFDRESLILQELRRDVDTAVFQAAQALLLIGGLPPQPTVTLWQLETAMALRGELAAVMAALPTLPSGAPAAIAFASRDTVLAPGDPALTWLSAQLADQPGVAATRLALAATFFPPLGWPAAIFRQLVATLGLLGQLEAAIPADPTSAARLEWDTAPNVGFAGPVMAALAGAVGPAQTLAAVSLVPPLPATPAASLRQLKAALATLGQLGNAEAAIEELPTASGVFGFSMADLASLEWSGGTGVAAGDPLMSVLAAALGFSTTQQGELLAYAAEIQFA